LSDPPEDSAKRAIVREVSGAMNIILERELGCEIELVVIARPKGTKRAYFCTNTPDAPGMMQELIDHLPDAVVQIARLQPKEQMN